MHALVVAVAVLLALGRRLVARRVAVRAAVGAGAHVQPVAAEARPVEVEDLVEEAGAGLVERRPKADGRRALEVWLTDAGWAAAERVAVCGAEVDAIAHANMTPNERETLSRLLARVIDNFAAEEEKNA